jgi:4-amino-4-deoxy-L-arabinose transferase-like glycosyltransferase
MKKIFPIILLTIISAFLIFYRLTEIPKNLSFDEVEFTKLALSLNNKPYISYSQLATGHSTLYFYILLTSLKIFGLNTFALRLPAAIFGILSTIFFYLIMQKVFKQQKFSTPYHLPPTPFLITLIFLSSHWFLNFARFSFEATFLLFLELVSIYFLISFWQEKRNQNIFLLISGLFAGLAFLSYTPGRIFFLLPLSFLILQTLQTLKLYKLAYFLIPFLIIITPLSNYLLTNNDTRIDQQFFLKNKEMTINEKVDGLWKNISSTALMFNVKGDVNGRHNYPNKPALNPILGILFIIGLIISIKNFKNLYNKLFLLYFLISLFPALMTYPWENPNMLRTFTALPSAVYFIGIVIYYLGTLAHHSFNEGGIVQKLLLKSKWKYLIFNTFYLILIFSCFYELRTYFKYQSTVFNQAFEIKLPLEKAIKVKLKP